MKMKSFPKATFCNKIIFNAKDIMLPLKLNALLKVKFCIK